jgi:hypothetical protein
MITYLLSSYQKGAYLDAVLESIRLDRVGMPSEVFIIDDGSRDRSWEQIAEFSASNEGVKAVRQENRGIYAVMNQLLAEGSMPWIRIIDSDDPIVPGSSALLIETATRAAAEYVFGDALAYGPDPKQIADLRLDLPPNPRVDVFKDPLEHAIRGYNHVPSCTLIARRALKDCKPLPETFISCQDLALALQIFPYHCVAHAAVPACHQLVGVQGRLSSNEALTFHQTLRLIQYYGPDLFDDRYRRMAASKLISRSMRWARKNSRSLPWREWAHLAGLRLRLRFVRNFSWDAYLDAAAAPLEQAISHPLSNARPY